MIFSLMSPFFRLKRMRFRKFSKLPKITQLGIGRAVIRAGDSDKKRHTFMGLQLAFCMEVLEVLG